MKILIFLLLLPSICLAEQIPLHLGMSMSDVIKLKGSPKIKDEHEVSRIIKWTYDDATVIFKNGLIAAAVQKQKSASLSAQRIAAASVRNPPTEISQEIADDIIKAIPNDPGGGISSGPGNSPLGSGQMVPANPVMIPED